MLPEDFDKEGPYLVSDPRSGPEPNLRFILFSYYRTHFEHDSAHQIVQEYIDGWCAKHHPTSEKQDETKAD